MYVTPFTFLHRYYRFFSSFNLFGCISNISGYSVHHASSRERNGNIVFYEVTLSKDNAYLVTGNKKHFPKTPIAVTPAEMLESLQQETII